MNRNTTAILLAASFALALSACAKEEPAAPAPSEGKTVATDAAQVVNRTIEEQMARGKTLYSAHCAACHQASGQGLAGAFPPLAESDYLGGGAAAAIDVVINGLKGPITVNGVEYNAVMPNLSYLSDTEVADIVTYVMNSWGNPGGVASPSEVAAARPR